MLTKEEKERIHIEEIYRREVQRELEKKDPEKSWKQRIWTALNSAFLLWFLSSIVIACITFIYTNWDNQRKQELERSSNIKKLDTEISSRLSFFSEGLHNAPDDKSILKSIVGLEKPSIADYPINVFQEYENRSLRSLLWELLQLVPENEKPEIQKAYGQSKVLYSIYLSVSAKQALSSQESKPGNNASPDKSPKTSEIRETLKSIESQFDLEISKSNIVEIIKAFNMERWNKPFATSI